MTRRICRSLVFLLPVAFLAAVLPARAQTGTPTTTVTPMPSVTPTPTPVSFDKCLEKENIAAQAYCVAQNYPLSCAIGFIVFLGFGALIWVIVRSAGEEWGKRLAGWLADLLHLGSYQSRKYLKWFISQYEDPKFGPLSLMVQFTEAKPAKLKDIYLPVEVAFELTDSERAILGKEAKRPDKQDKQSDLLHAGLAEQGKTLGLMDALKRSRVLVIIGIPGSGKSTLLQWAGLACAHARLGRRFKGQKELLKTLGAPLLPFFVSLGGFDRDCLKNGRQRTAASLLDYLTERYRSLCEPRTGKQPIPTDFFVRRLRGGCLLLFDGVDEVAPEQRAAVRHAVQEFLEAYASHPRTRVMLTARPSAAGEAQLAEARRGRVSPLDKPRRDTLIRNLYGYYESNQADRRSADLIQRIDASDERVRKLAETPLLTTIFVIIHRPGHELPHQRAEVYDRAIDTLLRELHRKDEYASESPETVEQDAASMRDRLARIAFHLHLAGRGEEGMAEDDLINALFPDFPTVAAGSQAKQDEIRRFLYSVAYRGGLLEEQDCTFGFRTHRSFQEFLAGWHLVNSYAPGNLERQGDFIARHLDDDAWAEPIRLAAGYLAVHGEENANAFIQMMMNLGKNRAERDVAVALAGMCLADLPMLRVRRELREILTPKMLDVLKRKRPTLSVRLRADLGIALGSLKDPAELRRLFDTRLHPAGLPELVDVQSGPFRMGTNAADEESLKAQGVEERYIWDDEKTGDQDIVVKLSEFAIGRYPVTNAEFRAFWEAEGYGRLGGVKPDWWSEDGWRWRNGELEPNISAYPENIREDVRQWLERRPVELRDQPFWWNDPQLNIANLPVVGVCWFEAEAYCKWLSAATSRNFSLPTEAQWEAAARGPEGFLWPWGNTWNPAKCNSAEPEDRIGMPSPVGIYPDGASPCGALDMAGNVWEWCADWFAEDTYQKRAGSSVVDPRGPETGQLRVVRGGSWFNYRNNARCAYRGWFIPDFFFISLGFRLVLSPI